MACDKLALCRSYKALQHKLLYRGCPNPHSRVHDIFDVENFAADLLEVSADFLPTCPYPDKTYCTLTSFLTGKKVAPAKLLKKLKNVMDDNNVSYPQKKSNPWTLDCKIATSCEPTSFLVNFFQGEWAGGIVGSCLVEMHFCAGEVKSFHRLAETVRLKLDLVFAHEELQVHSNETKSKNGTHLRVLNSGNRPLKKANYELNTRCLEQSLAFLKNLESPFSDVKKGALKFMLADANEFRAHLPCEVIDKIVATVQEHTKENIDFGIRETAKKFISLLQSC